jgi:hypothetical protein
MAARDVKYVGYHFDVSKGDASLVFAANRYFTSKAGEPLVTGEAVVAALAADGVVLSRRVPRAGEGR